LPPSLREQSAKEILEEAAEIDAAENEQRRLDDQRAGEARPIPASRPAEGGQAPSRRRAVDGVPGQRGL
jgi:hypothetical protein